MIRAHRVSAAAQDDASLVSGWNIAPNVVYILRLLPGTSSCGVLLYDDGNTLLASGAALAGTEQPCVLIPQAEQGVDMVDAELGWHLLLTTTGTESQREIRIGPSVDIPDEIHPVYADDDMALARATAAIDDAAHYRDDVAVTCPLGLGVGLGGIVLVPVDGVSVIGHVESITWTGTPSGTIDQAVIRRHVAIVPDLFVEPTPVTPPIVADDIAETDEDTAISGNVLTNDEAGLTVVAVNGLSANVGMTVAGSNGGAFVINSDGTWTFSPGVEFAYLSGTETVATAVSYHASNGATESEAMLTIIVSAATAKSGLLDCGRYSTVAVKTSQLPIGTGNTGNGDLNFSGWADIVAVGCGANHTVGLKSDGTAVAVGLNGNGQCNVSAWSDIVSIAAFEFVSVALKSDGTVVGAGLNSSGQLNVSSWTDIIAIAAGGAHTIGLESDGTVVAVGSNTYGQLNVSGWTDIVAIASGSYHTIGLKSDGTVVATGRNNYSQLNVSGWTDIVAIAADAYHTVGLKSDGTVVAVGRNYGSNLNVSGWTGIVAIAAGEQHTVGLKPDGTAVAVGTNNYNQCNVTTWVDLSTP